MHERDTPAAGAAPWHLVDETVPRRPAALERLVQIRHAVADMMDARPTLGEELRHRAVRVAGLEELDLNVAQRQADDRCTVGRLGAPRLEAEHVAIEAEGGVDGRNGDADVGNAGAWLSHDAVNITIAREGVERSWQRNISRPSRTPRSGWRSSSTRGSPSWTSGQRGAGRATWWHPFWTSWRESIKAS